MRVSPGKPNPLGATWDGKGVNFAIFSAHASAVELCLFESPDEAVEAARVSLPECTNGVWHAYLPDARPGLAYGYRVHGRYAPQQGHRFNPAKLLVDPYARALSRTAEWNDAFLGYRASEDQNESIEPDRRDSAPFAPRSVVVASDFSWDDDSPPATAWQDTVIYECHVKGLSILHPLVPEALRGTYLGLASEPVVAHLLKLGVTAVELLPVHHAFTERRLSQRGLSNYWGYNSIGYFAPDLRYANGGLGSQVPEFKSMVKALHRSGIEVILDVVYNHTAEGDRLGPTLFLRGIDNTTYYRLDPNDPSEYVNYTGCGNTLNLQHPQTLRLILDSLRYWVQQMHVDGFRFDLATILARGAGGLEKAAPFLTAVHQDPVLCQIKLIAEPWDLGPDGYQLGSFPAGWAEWNSKYRETVRRFWRGDPGQVGQLASRLAGSSDVFAPSGRGPDASINYVACHDGFTVRDLVSYEQKHNWANREDNRDGSDHSQSRNWGVEGPTEDPNVLHLRDRAVRNLLATLALSQGVPMISHGDEMGRTQDGNNNVYCQDNQLSWVNWKLDARTRDLLAFAQRALALRREHALLRRRTFLSGRPDPATGRKDLSWIREDGEELTDRDWHDPERRSLGMLLCDDASNDLADRPRGVRDAREGNAEPRSLLLLLNGGGRPLRFTLPELAEPGHWQVLLDTASRASVQVAQRIVELDGHCLLLLRYGAQ